MQPCSCYTPSSRLVNNKSPAARQPSKTISLLMKAKRQGVLLCTGADIVRGVRTPNLGVHNSADGPRIRISLAV